MVVLAVALLGPGCDSPSQLVLGFATDLSAPNVIDRVDLHVYDPTGNELLSRDWTLPGVRARDFRLPGSFTLFADRGAEPTVRVVLSGYLGTDPSPVVTRTAQVQLVSEATLFSRMALVQRCMGMVCGDGQSCIDGRCKTETVNAISLKPYAPGREESVECPSASALIDTSTMAPMPTEGDGVCGADEWCGEATCYRDQGQGLLWCNPPGSTCGGVDGYETCLVAACGGPLAACYGADWRRGHFDGPCKDYAACRSACRCDPTCLSACDAGRGAACGACLDGSGGVTSCLSIADGACQEPGCTPIAGGADLGKPPLGDMGVPVDGGVLPGKIFIPGGTYTIGCDPADMDPYCGSDAQPPHQVMVGGYYLDPYEITQADWATCVAASSCTPPVASTYNPSATPDLPVTDITWAQASVFCTQHALAIGASQGRLPSEAEWEIAAHGVVNATTAGTFYPWGNTDPTDCTLAIWSICSPTGPATIGGRPGGASPFMVQDLAGNVLEWVGDGYDPMQYTIDAASGVVVNPMGASGSALKVQRGGSYLSSASDLRATARRGVDPGSTSPDVGFRCMYLP